MSAVYPALFYSHHKTCPTINVKLTHDPDPYQIKNNEYSNYSPKGIPTQSEFLIFTASALGVVKVQITVWIDEDAVFWVVALCNLVEVYQRFRGPCCLHHQGDVHSSP
jgi:hypothetical protein